MSVRKSWQIRRTPVAMLWLLGLPLWTACAAVTDGELGYRIHEVGHGPEDLVIDRWTDPGRPRLIISSVRRPSALPALLQRMLGRKPCGELLSVPLLDDGLGQPAAMTIRGNEPLAAQPVGISLWPEDPQDGEDLYLFVTAKPCGHEDSSKSNEVRKYRIVDDTLEPEGPAPSHPLLKAPNGIAAIGPDELYVSNFPQRRGKVLHYDAGTWTELVELPGLEESPGRERSGFRLQQEFRGPNGIAYSRNDNLLYIADFNRQVVRRLSLEKGVGELRPIVFSEPPGHPDNLHWDSQGRLIIVTHRSRLRSLLHLLFGWRAPWDVWRFDPRDPRKPPETILSQERLKRGHRGKIDAASSATVHKDLLIVGQLRRPGVLVVRLDPSD